MSDTEQVSTMDLLDAEDARSFAEILAETGLVIAIVDDGVVLGLSAEKLEELHKLSLDNKSKTVSIFVADDINQENTEVDTPDGLLN